MRPSRRTCCPHTWRSCGNLLINYNSRVVDRAVRLYCLKCRLHSQPIWHGALTEEEFEILCSGFRYYRYILFRNKNVKLAFPLTLVMFEDCLLDSCFSENKKKHIDKFSRRLAIYEQGPIQTVTHSQSTPAHYKHTPHCDWTQWCNST